MKTDIVQKCTADYLQKIRAYKQQQAKLQENIDDSHRKIAWHEKRIIRFSKQQENIKRPWWVDEIIVPVMVEVARLTPGVTWNIERLNVHGLRAACSVFGDTENEQTVGLTFTFDNDMLSYDTGEVTCRFDSGTIGAINGMNNVSAPVEGVDVLIARINEQLAKLNTKTDEPLRTD